MIKQGVVLTMLLLGTERALGQTYVESATRPRPAQVTCYTVDSYTLQVEGDSRQATVIGRYGLLTRDVDTVKLTGLSEADVTVLRAAVTSQARMCIKTTRHYNGTTNWLGNKNYLTTTELYLEGK